MWYHVILRDIRDTTYLTYHIISHRITSYQQCCITVTVSHRIRGIIVSGIRSACFWYPSAALIHRMHSAHPTTRYHAISRIRYHGFWYQRYHVESRRIESYPDTYVWYALIFRDMPDTASRKRRRFVQKRKLSPLVAIELAPSRCGKRQGAP